MKLDKICEITKLKVLQQEEQKELESELDKIIPMEMYEDPFYDEDDVDGDQNYVPKAKKSKRGNNSNSESTKSNSNPGKRNHRKQKTTKLSPRQRLIRLNERLQSKGGTHTAMSESHQAIQSCSSVMQKWLVPGKNVLSEESPQNSSVKARVDTSVGQSWKAPSKEKNSSVKAISQINTECSIERVSR